MWLTVVDRHQTKAWWDHSTPATTFWPVEAPVSLGWKKHKNKDKKTLWLELPLRCRGSKMNIRHGLEKGDFSVCDKVS